VGSRRDRSLPSIGDPPGKAVCIVAAASGRETAGGSPVHEANSAARCELGSETYAVKVGIGPNADNAIDIRSTSLIGGMARLV